MMLMQKQTTQKFHSATMLMQEQSTPYPSDTRLLPHFSWLLHPSTTRSQKAQPNQTTPYLSVANLTNWLANMSLHQIIPSSASRWLSSKFWFWFLREHKLLQPLSKHSPTEIRLLHIATHPSWLLFIAIPKYPFISTMIAEHFLREIGKTQTKEMKSLCSSSRTYHRCSRWHRPHWP